MAVERPKNKKIILETIQYTKKTLGESEELEEKKKEK